MNLSFKARPVYDRAVAAIRDRIEAAEQAFAHEAEALEAQCQKEIRALETKLEADTEAALKQHVSQLFRPLA